MILRRLLIVSLSAIISFPACFSQPDASVNIIATYGARHGGFIEVPDRLGKRAQQGWIWHLVADYDGDGPDDPQIDGENIGMPFGDDNLLSEGVLCDGKYAPDSLAACVSLVTVDSRLYGIPVYLRFFGSDSLTEGIPFTQTLGTGALPDWRFMRLFTAIVMPYGYGGIMESWLSPEGLPQSRDFSPDNPTSTRLNVYISERAYAEFLGNNGHGLLYHNLCHFSGVHPTWNFDTPSLDFSVTVSVDFTGDTTFYDYEHKLHVRFSETEVQELYGEQISARDMRVWHETDSSWVALETRVIIHGDTIWQATYQCESPPLSGRFTLAPEDLNPMEHISEAIITEYRLYPAYPNPFNPATRFNLDLVDSRQTYIEVFNILGRKVKTLYRGELSAGRHVFTLDAKKQASGIYFIRVKAGDFTAMQKIVLLR